MDYSPPNRGGHTGGQRLYPLGPARDRRGHEVVVAAAARDRRYDERDDGDEVQDLRNSHRPQYRNNDRNENDNRDGGSGDGRDRGAASGRGGRSGGGGPNLQRDVHSYQVEDERQQPVRRQPNREDFYDGRHRLERNERLENDRGEAVRNDRLNHRENDNNYQVSIERRGPPSRDEHEYEADHPRARQPPNNQRRQQRVHQQDETIYEDPQLLHEQNYDHPPLSDYREGRLQDRNAFYAERPQARIQHSSDPDRDYSNRNPPNARPRARVHYEDDEGPDYGYPPTAHQNPPLNHQQFVRENSNLNSNYPPQMNNRQGIPQREHHPRAPPPPPPPPPPPLQQQRDEQNLNESVYDNVPDQDERSRRPPMDPFQNSLPRNDRSNALRRPSEDLIRVQQQPNRQPIHQGKYGPPLRSQQEEYEHEQQRLQQHPQPRPQQPPPQQQQPQQQQQSRRPSVYQHPPETFYDNFPRREEPVQERLHQRSQQSPAVIHNNENVYNEISNHSNREEHGRPPPDDQRRQHRVHQQVDTDYEDPPLNSSEQNYDTPPTSADDRRQNRPQERNRVYEEPPSNHNQYHRNCFSMRVQCGSAATSPQPEHIQDREEETLPESQQWNVRRIAAPQQPEHVQVEAEETSPPTTLLPAPEQWNIRRIIPRQTRDQRNGNNNINGIINQEDQSFVEIVDDNIGRGATNQPIIEANEGWDTPIPGPEEVAPLSSSFQEAPVAASQSNHFSGRGGGQGGFNYPLQHHRYQSTRNQNNNNNNNNNNNLQSFDTTNDEHQQQPQRPPRNDEDFFGGFEDGFAPPHRSFRPPTYGEQGGRQGYGGQNEYSGYQPQNFQSDSERSRAPRDYVPKKRELEEIYNEDKAEISKYGNTICENDAEIEVIGEKVVVQKCDHWEEMELNPQLLKNLQQSEYLRPRNIQKFCFPYIEEGLNVQCQSETGSGKTVAFLVPIIEKLINLNENGLLPVEPENPTALIIAPTRELVTQLYEQALKLTNGTNISVACAYGQYNVGRNIEDIKNGCNILCACVGRLLDLIDRRALSIRDVQFLVLDEPDRLLRDFDDGCDILKVMNHVELPSKSDRQTLLFSATLRDPNVEKLVLEHIDLNNTIMINAKKESNCRIKYVVLAVPSIPSKFRYLIEYLKEIKAENNGICPKVLVFTNRRAQIEPIAIDVTNNGFPATTIHGGRAQDLREEAYEYFRNGKATVLVATDVCARGVDIHEMDYVINYDLPDEKAGFLQRCGRTGRTHPGIAVSFYCHYRDVGIADIIVDVIEESGQIPPEFLRTVVTDADYKYGTSEDNNIIAQNVSDEIVNERTAEEVAAIEEEWN